MNFPLRTEKKASRRLLKLGCLGFLFLGFGAWGCTPVPPPGAVFELTPSPVYFSGAGSKTIKIKNLEASSHNIETLGAIPTAYYSVSNTCKGNLAGGASCTETVTCLSPGHLGEFFLTADGGWIAAKDNLSC
jgi:hypothetical protein